MGLLVGGLESVVVASVVVASVVVSVVVVSEVVVATVVDVSVVVVSVVVASAVVVAAVVVALEVFDFRALNFARAFRREFAKLRADVLRVEYARYSDVSSSVVHCWLCFNLIFLKKMKNIKLRLEFNS